MAATTAGSAARLWSYAGAAGSGQDLTPDHGPGAHTSGAPVNLPKHGFCQDINTLSAVKTHLVGLKHCCLELFFFFNTIRGTLCQWQRQLAR